MLKIMLWYYYNIGIYVHGKIRFEPGGGERQGLGPRNDGRDPFNQNSGNFGPKLNGSVRSNRKSFEKTGPPFEVVLFSRSDRSEFWLNGSRPMFSQLAKRSPSVVVSG